MDADLGTVVEDASEIADDMPPHEVTRYISHKYDLSGREAARVTTKIYSDEEFDPESLETSITRRRLLKKGALLGSGLLTVGGADWGANQLTDDAIIDDWDHANDESILEAVNGETVNVGVMNYAEADYNRRGVEEAFEGLGIDVQLNDYEMDGDLSEFESDATDVDNYPDVREFAESGPMFDDHDGREGDELYLVLDDELPFAAVRGDDDFGNDHAEYAFIDSSRDGNLPENEMVRQLGYSFGLQEVDMPVYGDIDVMGSSPVRDQLAQRTMLGFSKASQKRWEQIRGDYK
jgi:hypothetical protein